MPFPTYKDIQRPLLEELRARGGAAEPAAIYDLLANRFQLTESERHATLESEPDRNKWENMVRWVRNDLRKLGEVDGDEHGIWRLTEKGSLRLTTESVGLLPTSEKLREGDVYTRAQLATMFEVPGSGAINNGVFRPDRKRYASIWLFVTKHKPPDRPQLVDKLDGNVLHWQGQPEQGTDNWIINHEANGLEVLLFYREKRDSYPHGGFRFEGTFQYVSHDAASKPTDFQLKRKDSLLEMIEADIEAIDIEQEYREGRVRQVLTNRYERNPRARAAAVQLHGTTCLGCGFSFGQFYGAHGEGFIQVHHIKPIATYGEHVEIDPANDMTVLCSNCHSMVHRRPDHPLTLDELKQIIQNQKS